MRDLGAQAARELAVDEAADVAIIGAGVVGCAIAARLAAPGRSVIVLEAAPQIGTGVSSRSSGVIHSGLYYPPGSLKAETCVRGNHLLYDWARRHGVWHQTTGKLVVARHARQEDALADLYANARANDAPSIALLTQAEVAAKEPDLPASSALYCPKTGIIDVHELCLSLRAAAEDRGATFVLGARTTAITKGARDFELVTTRGELRAARVVNAAGLFADEIARLVGLDRYTLYPCRGDYFRLRSAVRYRHLIYPVRDPGDPGLGVHLTLERGGGYRLGPDVHYVAARDDFSDPPAAKHAVFLAAAERLLGPLDPSALSYDSCGIRPKLRAPSEPEEKDFVVTEDPPGILHFIGIESPGITAALALAERAEAWLD